MPQERPIVASVYENRLSKGMALDCDPTTIYAALLDARYRGTIYRSDLASDNAYNTYSHAGLPPGPIANPGVAALKAALAPAQTDYLYFVAKAGWLRRPSVLGNDGAAQYGRTAVSPGQQASRSSATTSAPEKASSLHKTSPRRIGHASVPIGLSSALRSQPGRPCVPRSQVPAHSRSPAGRAISPSRPISSSRNLLPMMTFCESTTQAGCIA